MSSTITALTSGGGLAMAGDTSGQLELKTNNGTTAVTISTTQNVGIGTSSPARKLQVHEATAATNAYFQLSNDATGATSTDGFQLIVGTAGETILAQRENAEMQFWTNNTEQMRLTGAGNFQFNSGYGSVATAYGCRAWVNFNGTGTPAIRASGNVSSITDNATGDYTINFTTALTDANYGIANAQGYHTGVSESTFTVVNTTNAPTTSAYRIKTYNSGGTIFDPSYVLSSVFR